ncbi:MAG TPA: hypothetical protein VFU49_18190 [Ktedonobacteraceae bacterium]|nr:hypothetical protein [Ktedonobacteraceae bacterium]
MGLPPRPALRLQLIPSSKKSTFAPPSFPPLLPIMGDLESRAEVL